MTRGDLFSVNLKKVLPDLSIALMYYQTSEASCDINLDGVVNTLDYIIIASYIR